MFTWTRCDIWAGLVVIFEKMSIREKLLMKKIKKREKKKKELALKKQNDQTVQNSDGKCELSSGLLG